MISIHDISSLDNLYLAWCKLEKCAAFTEAWYSEVDFKRFKLNLKDELNSLSQDLLDGKFTLTPIRPIPYPKGSGKDGNLRVRQAFRFSVRDQVVWIALCNIIGGVADGNMPGWSYGNRLYLPMWKARQQDIEAGRAPNSNRWVFGNYRNTKPFLYRKWKQSWPMFRRMVTTSLRKMAKVELSDSDVQNIEEIQYLPASHTLPYLEKGYFKSEQINETVNKDNPDETSQPLYWMSIDLSKFYPTIDLNSLKNILIEECKIEEPLFDFINKLFDFQIDYSGMSEDVLKGMGLIDDNGFPIQLGLPTGLVVAGWLANVYFLPIDKIISERLQANRNVIHFRYVDDHTIIANSAQVLLEWIDEYANILKSRGLLINEEKMTPLGSDSLDLMHKLIEQNINEAERKKLSAAIENQCAIDPQYPSPLMTQTLEKISGMADMKLGLMTQREKKNMFHDLQTLIVTDIPEEEIKKETRISFASTMLSRLMEGEDFDHHLIYNHRVTLHHCLKRYTSIIAQQANEGSDACMRARDAVECIKQILFDPHPQINPDIWQVLTSEEGECCKAIIDHLSETRWGFFQKAKRISDLLQKAVKDAPDKLNLWSRLLKFTLYNIPQRTLSVFKLLDRQRDDHKLHHESYRYIKSQLETVASIALVRSVFSLFHKTKLVSPSLVETLEIQRIEEIMKLPQYIDKAEIYYQQEAQYTLLMAKAFKKLVLDSDRTLFLYIVEMGYSPAFCMLWCMSTLRLEEALHFDVFKLIPELDSLINEKDAYGAILVKTLSCQPIDYSNTALRRLKDCFDQKDIPVPPESREFENEEYINVAKWIAILKNRPIDKEVAIDIESGPYESEYIAMRAIVALMEEWSAQMKDRDNDNPLSPLSFYFRLKDIRTGWESVEKDMEIKVRIGEESDYDKNYPYPPFVKSKYDKSVFSIGIWLLQLLSLNEDISWILNQPEYGYKWTHLLNSIFSKGKISSCVYRLIEECLSPITRENNALKDLLGENYLDLPFFEDYKIKNVNELKNKVHNIAEKNLWSNILCLAHNRHIELTVIDLK